MFLVLTRRRFSFRRCQELQAVGGPAWVAGPQTWREADGWGCRAHPGKERDCWLHVPLVLWFMSPSHHSLPSALSKHCYYHGIKKLEQNKLSFFCSGFSRYLEDKGKTKCVENSILNTNKYISTHAYINNLFFRFFFLEFQENKILVINKDFGIYLGNGWYRSFHFLEYTYYCKKQCCWRCYWK